MNLTFSHTFLQNDKDFHLFFFSSETLSINMSKRGSEPSKRAYSSSHRNEEKDQDTAHYYSHEINNHIKGNRGITSSRDHFVDHSDNFRMSSPSTNRSTHRCIDNDFISSSRTGDAQWHTGISSDAYENRFRQQVSSLKSSGGLDDRDIYNFYNSVGEDYGFDRRCLKGSKWY